MWIHELPNWPHFQWDAGALTTKLAQVRYEQGRLLGRMSELGFDLEAQANLTTLTHDVVKTSAIEGEFFEAHEVRSSLARHLGINIAGLTTSSRAVDGVVEMMLDATQSYSEPLTKERIWSWHASLFPSGHSGIHPIATGCWRGPEAGPMQVVSGPIGRARIHFEAPDAHRLIGEMHRFLQWYNTPHSSTAQSMTLDLVLKAGIAHFWFVTIHPFEDGNGRIARAIGDRTLAQADHSAARYYSLSSQIEAERKDYYTRLERQQRSQQLDLTAWLDWFLGCLYRALGNAEHTLSRILFKSRLWDWINQNPVNERQKKIINLMLEGNFKGYINTSKYAKLCKCSNDTALRDIQELKARGILLQNPGRGRSTSYRLVDALYP